MANQKTQVAETEKILTVSIAAYNGEKTLSKALESCVVQGIEQLDVIVVDDGSTDHTSAIAEHYAAQWPDSFRVIRQPNGGYGSALMTGLANARGKYFRTLDCDDWFDVDALKAMLRYLEKCNTDIVFSNYCTVGAEQIQNVFDVCKEYETKKSYTFDELGQRELDLEIHGMTCRTRMLRAADIRLPMHCSYTDMAYTFMAMNAARTISFCPVTLYHYQLGRDGQSVGIDNYQKHFDDYAKVADQIMTLADSLPAGDKEERLRNRARDVAQYGIELLLRFVPGAETKQRLIKYDTALRSRHPEIARQMTNKNTRMLRASRYGLYGINSWWQKRKLARMNIGK